MKKTVHSEAYKKSLSELKESRRKNGLTQQDVAKRLGRPQSFVAKYERGERRLDVLEFIAVARVLDLDPGTVFGRLVKRVR